MWSRIDDVETDSCSASRPTFAPYNQEIHASHVKVIDEKGKIVHTSALLRNILADVKESNKVLVQVGGLVYLPPAIRKTQPGTEGATTQAPLKPLRPPWREAPPICRLFSREELRATAQEEEKNVREVERQKRSAKEIETSWSVSPQDLVYVRRRLEDFLNEGRAVSVIIRRTKKWKAPAEEDVERTLAGIRAAAEGVRGAYEEKGDGTPGSSMILEFKVRAEISGESGKWKGLVPGKIIKISWQMGENQLEPLLKEMRQSLRKGKHVAVKIEEHVDGSIKVKGGLNPSQIISQIRLAAGNVKDAVEILPQLPKTAPSEESACEGRAPWELRFEANSKKQNAPRMITIDSSDSTKQLNLKLDWAEDYLNNNLQTRLCMHADQVDAAKSLLEQRGAEVDETGNINEYTTFEVKRCPRLQVEEVQPLKSTEATPPTNRRSIDQPNSRRQPRPRNVDAINDLLELFSNGKRQSQGPGR
jgi:translation initiation factor IF-3